MKVGSLARRGSYFVIVLGLGLSFSGCSKNVDQASASLPAASPSLYPSSLQAAPAEGSIWSANDIEPETKPEKPKPKPFVLRTGESLANYKVQKGDTLGKISAKYGTSIGRVKAANGLNNDTIYAGKIYKIPTRKSESEIETITSMASMSHKGSAPKGSTMKTTAPAPPTFKSPPTTISSSPPRSFAPSIPSGSTSKPRTFSPPPTSTRPTFTPRPFDYNGPTISTPSQSASITIPTGEASSGGGSAFQAPSFDSSF